MCRAGVTVKHTLLGFSSPSNGYCMHYIKVLGFPHDLFDLPGPVFEIGQVRASCHFGVG